MRRLRNKIYSLFIAIVLIAAIGITQTLTAMADFEAVYEEEAVIARADGLKTPPEEIKESSSNYGYDFKITFSEDAGEWLHKVTGVTVGGISYTAADSSFGVWNNTNYYVDAGNGYLFIGEAAVDGSAECIITAEGYTDLTLELNKNSHTVIIKPSQGGGDTVCEHSGGTATCLQKAVCEKCGDEYGELGEHNYVNGVCTVCKNTLSSAPTVTVDGSESTYFILKVDIGDYVQGISSISCNEIPLEKTDYKMALNGTKYYLDKENNAIYFDKMSGIPFPSGGILTITNPSYQDLRLKLLITGQDVTLTPADQNTGQGDEYTLYVRLVGYFESALVNQSGYDAISGASTNVTQNKNSNVVVEAALLPKDTEPGEENWKLLHETGYELDKTKSTVNMDNTMGMAGIYSPYDSSLTLAGIPSKAGEYPISVTITDKQGRTATSNSLVFKVYSGEEYLENQLTLENCTQTQDGKYMYDMEPWAMKNFDDNDQTVTVPKDVKAWYGSHTSGTYGKLGYAISEGEESVQTLLIPDGCNLTLVNMDILSSVRIVVCEGGSLNLRDSVAQGIIEVQDGGKFSMNYDDYAGKFLSGASINGQLILRDGAALENAMIYSNTNNIANGSEARHNTNPVVVTEGNVTINGQVFIRGDEAPTGTDEATGKSYAGQPGLQVKDGTLTLTDNAVLAAYGGGHLATTSVGGAAIVLENGEITGAGKLIAVGGQGNFDDGGNAVDGKGSISVTNAYLEGGNTFMPKDGSIPGKAVNDQITLSNNTNRNLVDGKAVNSESENVDTGTYWSGTTVPTVDETKYPVESNAPGETMTPTPTPTPDPVNPPIYVHSHSWQSIWSKDETQHWHECSTCHEKKDVAAHTDDAICQVCGAQRKEEEPAPVKAWTVTYKANTSSKVSSMPSDKNSYEDGTKVTVKGLPTRTNAFFAGWNTKADGSGTSYVAGKTFSITENTTLYAQWKSIHTTSTKLRYKVTGTKVVSCIGTADKNAKIIKIPNTITYKGITYKVTSVGRKAFCYNEVITTVTIGNQVKTIHDFAFFKCTSLKKVTIGTGLTTLKQHIFCHAKKGCTVTIKSKNLKTVTTAMNHGAQNMTVKVPKAKVKAYTKLFASKSIKVKAI